MTPIEVRKLSKNFGTTRALDNISFTVPAGAITGFIGGNGSGKTTTIRALLGLTKPTSGEALINGLPYRSITDPRRVVGAVIDRIGAHPSYSARQHLAMVATSAGLPPDQVAHCLDLVGLSDVADRPIGEFSMGMTQRCSLAVALLGSPPILILDEPANGLDPAGIRWLRNTMRNWADDGRTVLVSTHQIAELAPIVDHLVVLDSGCVVYQGTAANIIRPGRTLEDSIFDLLDSSTSEIHDAELQRDRKSLGEEQALLYEKSAYQRRAQT